MLKKINSNNMFLSNQGWLKSRFHFSFAEYRNFDNINFGVLRVLNDDLIEANSGFDTHPHNNMEIITYIVNGEITHKDSMGNEEVLKRGEVQYMSAGTGIQHSEFNRSDKETRLLQMWILPPKKDLKPIYGSKKYNQNDTKNKLINIVSSQQGTSEVKIHQDVNIYVSQLEKNRSIEFKIDENRQIYFVQIEGSSNINEEILNQADAMEIVDEKSLTIKALDFSHFLFIEMKKS